MVELALIVQVQKVLFLLHRVLMRVLNLVELASIWLMLHLTDLSCLQFWQVQVQKALFLCQGF